VSKHDWSATGRTLGLSENDALARLDRLRLAVPDAFKAAAEGPCVPAKLRNRAEDLATLVSAFVERRFDAWGRVDRSSKPQPFA
jgi:hypothetical protein